MQASPPRVAPAGTARHGSMLGRLRSSILSILMARRLTRSKSTRSNVAVLAGARTSRISTSDDARARSSGFGRKKRAGYLDRGKRPREESEQQQQRASNFRRSVKRLFDIGSSEKDLQRASAAGARASRVSTEASPPASNSAVDSNAPSSTDIGSGQNGAGSHRTRSGRAVSWLSLRLVRRASRHAAIPDHTSKTETGHQLSRMLDQAIQVEEPKAPKVTAHDRLYRGSTRTTQSEHSNRKSSAVSRKSSAKPTSHHRRSSAMARMSSAWG